MKNSLLLVFFVLPFICYSKISGKVVDASTGKPLEGVSVYINNSSFGTKSDINGYFELTEELAPPFNLIVSSVGYKVQSFEIKKQNDDLNVALEKQNTLLSEVTINAKNDPWAINGPIFFKEFIGYSSNAKQCKILNHEVISFYYNIDANQLQAFSSEPIQIENKALGYLISYRLEDFVIDYNRKATFFKGYSFFKELPPKNTKQKKIWDENRRAAFLGSVNHFIRALSQKSISSEGFELQTLIRFMGKDYGKFIPVWSDTALANVSSIIEVLNKHELPINSDSNLLEKALSQLEQDYLKTTSLPLRLNWPLGENKENIDQWITLKKTPSEKIILSYFDTLLSPPKSRIGNSSITPNTDNYVYQVKYTDLVPIDSVLITSPSQKKLAFQNFLIVTYKNEAEEHEYAASLRRVPEKVQESVMSLRQPIEIYPNGIYSNPYDLFIEGYWSFEKLDKLLPIDYKLP